MTPKDPIVSTRFVGEERFAGGVLACANHLAGYCGRVDLLTLLGSQDPQEEFIRSHLKANIRPTFLHREDSRTIVKRRFVDPAFLRKLFEVQYLPQAPLPRSVEERLIDFLRQHLESYDVVLVADYGHGMISRRIIEELCGRSRTLCVNTQTNSANYGYNPVTRYPRADYVCIDEPELRLAAGDPNSDLRELFLGICGKMKARRAAVTRGHLGCMTYDGNGGTVETPVFSTKIVDRTGAGDAFLSVTAPLVAVEAPPEVIGFVGNAAGALAVAIVCNREAVEPVPLIKFMTTLLR
jgi:sugar/nucleoside kinase (ribokinase family)